MRNVFNNNSSRSKFKRIPVMPDSSDEEDTDDIHNNGNNGSTSNNDTQRTSNTNNNAEYDSDEERDYLIEQETQYLKRQLEMESLEEEEKRLEREEQERIRLQWDNSNNSSNTVTSTTTTTTTSTTTSTTPNNHNNNGNNYINYSGTIASTSPHHTTIHIEDIEQDAQPPNGGDHNNNIGNDDILDEPEIGLEAQNILFIQNELSRPLNFYSLLRRLLFLCILYLFPVSIVLFIVLVMDWNHACDMPLKQWASVQIGIQLFLVSNFLYLLIGLPDNDDNGQPSPAVARIQYIFRTVHRILSSCWITWFIVGIIWVMRAKSHDKCTSSSPYLFWATYSVVVFQIIIASLTLLFCCCSCLFSMMRLGSMVSVQIVNQQQQQQDAGGTGPNRGATDTMLKKIPAKKYRVGMMPKDDCSCAICLSEYVEGDKVRVLPCKHHYHLNCVDRWLIINKACPFCKRDIDSSSSSSNSNTNHSNNHGGDDDNGGIELETFRGINFV